MSPINNSVSARYCNLFTEYSETEGDESAETKENVSFLPVLLICIFYFIHYTLIQNYVLLNNIFSHYIM